MDKMVFNFSFWVKLFNVFIWGVMVENGVKDLVGSGLNVIGVMVILNIGSFNMFIVVVWSYKFGILLFMYFDNFGLIKFKLVMN